MSFKGNAIVLTICIIGSSIAVGMAMPQFGALDFWGMILGLMWDNPVLIVLLGTVVVAGIAGDRFL